MTYGKMYGFSVVNRTPNVANTLNALYAITSKTGIESWTKATGLPSVRTDSLTQDPSKPVSSVFALSALWSRAWLDPKKEATDAIFKDMIESVTSAKHTTSEAIYTANTLLSHLVEE